MNNTIKSYLAGDLHQVNTTGKYVSDEPPYTESWVANLEGDMLDCLSGILTHGKIYDVTVDEYDKYVVLNDRGILKGYHHSWFTPVKLYDEDESELVCRDIEFKCGDYLVRSKHTDEQIIHLSKYLTFNDLCGWLQGNWEYLTWNGNSNKFSGYGVKPFGKEYHFNDLFYKEGE